MSEDEREAREKGLALVAHIEHLMQTNKGFRDWFQEGIDEIEAGHFVTFSENGWKESMSKQTVQGVEKEQVL